MLTTGLSPGNGNYSHEGSGASFGASANAATLTPGSFTPDASNTGHGYQVVSVPSFTVAAAAAPAIAVDPTSLSFGNVAVGSHLAKSITIQNTGTSALTVSNVALGSGTSAEYTISQTSVVVNPSESHAVTITYAPTDTTTDSGSILITSDDPAHATTTVSVSGTGTTAPNATASVDPASVAFGDVTVGANSAKTITVSNAGNAALTGTVALGSGTSSEYTFTPAALNVAAGASQTVTITYAPTDETTDTGQLVLTTNDPAHGTIGVALSGNGVTTTAPKITVTPASLDFGTIAQGTTKQLTAQITNGGNGTLNVTAVDRCTSPATSDEFTWSPAAPLNIAAGQSATLTVTYTANDLATEVGCLAITSNDQQSAITNLNVTGTGQASSTSGATGSGGATTTHSSSGCSTGEGSGSFAALALVAILALRRARRVDRPGSGS